MIIQREQLTLNTANGFQDSIVIAGNDMYDPMDAGGAQQPYGFDQLCALYRTWRVYGSRVIVTCDCADNTTYGARLVIIPYGQNSLSYESLDDLICTKRAHVDKFGYASNERGGDSSGRHFMKTKYMNPSWTVKDTTFTGYANQSPIQMWYWHVYVDNSTLRTPDPATVYLTIRVRYYVQWTQPKQQNNSVGE